MFRNFQTQLQQSHKLLCRNRPPVIVILRARSTGLQQKHRLLNGFFTFGNQMQIQTLRHYNDRAHHRCITGIIDHVTYKRLIYLVLLYREALKVRQS